MATKLLIFPYNGNGIEALDCLSGDYDLIGFVDDTTEKQGINEFGINVYGREAIQKFDDAKILVVPGSPESYKTRKILIDSLKLLEHRFISIIHPNASVSKYATIGHNVLIMANVSINASAKIGNHVCILPNTVVHHNSTIGDYCLIGSNVSVAGNTSIGRNCYIGCGSRIINNISVADNSLVGLGSNVIKSILKEAIVAGNPARIIRDI